MTTLWQRLHVEDPALPEPSSEGADWCEWPLGSSGFVRMLPWHSGIDAIISFHSPEDTPRCEAVFNTSSAAAKIRHLLGMPPKEGK